MRVLTNRFGASIALRLAHEGRRGLNAKKSDLFLEVVGEELRAMIVSKKEPLGHPLSKASKAKHWILQRHGYKTPAQVRSEQTLLVGKVA